MSVNKREEVLDRLFEVAKSAATEAGFATRVRNRGQLTNDKLPMFALLDGDEEAVQNGAGRGRGQFSPATVRMKPQLFIVEKSLLPNNVTEDEHKRNIGTLLNTHRGILLKAIAGDAQLLALLGPNGDIAYEGAETDLKTGMEMSGSMQISISLTCVLNPTR